MAQRKQKQRVSDTVGQSNDAQCRQKAARGAVRLRIDKSDSRAGKWSMRSGSNSIRRAVPVSPHLPRVAGPHGHGTFELGRVKKLEQEELNKK